MLYSLARVKLLFGLETGPPGLKCVPKFGRPFEETNKQTNKSSSQMQVMLSLVFKLEEMILLVVPKNNFIRTYA